MSIVDTTHLKALGSGKTEYLTPGEPLKGLLERFKNPMLECAPVNGIATGLVHIEVPEFTSLCPLTGQPDFATIVIDYRPHLWCVESKALKLYMMSFRNVGEFHESCVTRMARDLIDLLDPRHLTIEGRFTPRGGIPFWPRIAYERSKVGRHHDSAVPPIV